MGPFIYFIELGISTTLTIMVLVFHRRLFLWMFSPTWQDWPGIQNDN